MASCRARRTRTSLCIGLLVSRRMKIVSTLAADSQRALSLMLTSAH